ncbi:uncharacterized protein LOC102366783 [Latimeria chalumnae]|uniref:uncharacterized protein LOC102366783 n=1 Tax=Latimeria chalumnae TaxID=7897 RepID=UPI0003C1A45F|nr:PREDICTED: uncharacterized protein LOC102366783 [Latimeria chalumnae]|eukprot:XP_005996393.1 PREDICTED: uncharacterized protein LOC102366783 [Latimeria chalumnae]
MYSVGSNLRTRRFQPNQSLNHWNNVLSSAFNNKEHEETFTTKSPKFQTNKKRHKAIIERHSLEPLKNFSSFERNYIQKETSSLQKCQDKASKLEPDNEGYSSTTLIMAREHTNPPELQNIQRIIVDLRPALAGVNEPCETLEENSKSVSDNSISLMNIAKSRTNYLKDQQKKQGTSRQPQQNKKESRLRPAWGHKIVLPPIIPNIKHKTEQLLSNQCCSKDANLVQVTENGALASTRNQNISHQPPVSFPKIILQQKCHQDHPEITNMASEGYPSRDRYSPELQIPLHEILKRVKEKTTSKNHILITQVLRSLREGLWTDCNSMNTESENSLYFNTAEKELKKYRTEESEEVITSQANVTPVKMDTPVKISFLKNIPVLKLN